MLFQGPGKLFAFQSRASDDYVVQFDFVEDIVLSGIIITTRKPYFVKQLRVRANLDKNRPNFLSNTVYPAKQVSRVNK